MINIILCIATVFIILVKSQDGIEIHHSENYMNTKKASFLALSFGVILSVLITMAGVGSVQAGTTESGREFLNPDGTLKLDGSYSGLIDLKPWHVRLDPSHGPVLSAAQSLPPAGWSALGSGNSGNGSLSAEVWAIAVSGSNVYVGGFFTDVKNNNVPIPEADYIARWDGQNWSALGSNGAGNGSLNQFVTSIALVGGDLYVGGAFENVNNNGTVLPAADYLAKWNGTDWAAVGSNAAGGTGSLNGSVTAIAVDNSNPTQTNLYVGGLFTIVQDQRSSSIAHYIAKWDGQYWSALGSDGAGVELYNSVPRALAFSEGNLYVGGEFTDVNNDGVFLTAADYIAKWDGTNWSALGSNEAGNGSLNDIVYDIAVSGNNVYARRTVYGRKQPRNNLECRRLDCQMGWHELVCTWFE